VVQAGTRLEAIGWHRWASHWWQSASPLPHGVVARFQLRRGHRGCGRGSPSDEEPTRCCLTCSRLPLATGRQPHPPSPTLTASMRQPPVSGAGRRLRPPRGCADPGGRRHTLGRRAARGCDAWHRPRRKRCSAAIGGGGRREYQVDGGATANCVEVAALRTPPPVPPRHVIVACDGDRLLRPCGRGAAAQPRQPRPQAPAVSLPPRSAALPLTRRRVKNHYARIVK